MSTQAGRSFGGDAAVVPVSVPALMGTQDETIHADGLPPLAVRLYRGATSALVLHFHAGAFVGGSLDSGAGVARALADAGGTVASLDYPLAPERPFPQAVEAGWQALLWLDQQRRPLGLPHAPLFVAGEEAGGNLAAAVAMVARDRGAPALTGQILLSPMLDVCVATASQRDARSGPVGCPCADGWRAYLQRASDATHPYATPATAMRLGGLPATVLVTSQDDPLRDETRAFALRLRHAGVEAQAHVLPVNTGWPRSYQDSAPGWADALRALLRPVFAAGAPAAVRATLVQHPVST